MLDLLLFLPRFWHDEGIKTITIRGKMMKKNLILVCLLVTLGSTVSAKKGEKLKKIGQKVKAKVKAKVKKAGEKIKEVIKPTKEPYVAQRESGGCNGHKALCSRRYNEVAYAASHNATSKGPSIVNNQDITVRELMNRGVRQIKIPIHWGKDLGNNNGENPTACHGIYRATLYTDYYNAMLGKLGKKINGFFEKIKKVTNVLKDVPVPGAHMTVGELPGNIRLYIEGMKPLADMVQKGLPTLYGQRNTTPAAQLPFIPCALDPAAQLLKSVLADVKAFLDRNPRDIFTIKFENMMGIDVLATELVAAGLDRYVHKQDVTKPWPTLGEMVASNKRLVLFAKQEGPLFALEKNYAWSPVRAGGKAAGSVKSLKDLKTVNNMPTVDPNFKNRLAGPKNKLFNLTNVVTIGMGGWKSAAKKVNERSFLRERVKALGRKAGVIPNYIDTDFTEVPNGDVFDVVDELNGVGKYAGKPLLTSKDTPKEKRKEKRAARQEKRKEKRKSK